MQLLVQPQDGTDAVVQAIGQARRSVEIAIFRFDRSEIERALEAAADRGVRVHALIAFTNRSGEKKLRHLESRLLEKGIQVARTADDLVRYHGKMLIVDQRTLFVLGFNFTHLDLQSRGFGVMTRQPRVVAEAAQLFHCDCHRLKYTPGCAQLLVSPCNAREQLAAFIRGARRQLLIYDLEVSDQAMIELLQRRQKRGVEIRVLGWVARGANLERREPPMRLHARAMVRDGRAVFLGSQSLRALELDARREIGIVVQEAAVAQAMARIFEKDWGVAAAAPAGLSELVRAMPAGKALKKVAKAIARELPPLPALTEAVKEVIEEKSNGNGTVKTEQIEEAVKDAVKEAVKEAVKIAVSGEETAELEKVG